MLMDQHFTVRLSTNTPSIGSKKRIIREGNRFRLRLKPHLTHPIRLVTYLGRRQLWTDGFFGYKCTGETDVRYEVLQPNERAHFHVRLTFYPFYLPNGPIQRRNNRLWYGEKEPKIYGRCIEYAEIGSLPYQIVDAPAALPQPTPAPGHQQAPAAVPPAQRVQYQDLKCSQQLLSGT